MKYIIKNAEPQELLQWKQTDKMFLRGKPRWKRVPTETKDVVRESLKIEQGFICCYCERELTDADYHVEHLKPQGKNGFPQNQVDYDNLLCSCQLEIDKGAPRHCGNAKGSWYDSSLLVSPLQASCEQHFCYSLDGFIKPAEGDLPAEETIEKLKLDSDKLNKLREKAIEPFLDPELTRSEITHFISEYLKRSNGKFNPFVTTIEYLSSDLVSLGSP